MTGHAFLAPSAAGRWGPDGCSGSPAMEVHYPEVDSEEALEGTTAHWVVACALGGVAIDVGTIVQGTGLPVTAEMIECSNDFVRDIRDTLAACGPGATIHVEEKMPPGFNAHNWGTPDVFIIDWANRRMHLFDYKYGHRYVDAYMNWQLLNYLILVLLKNGVQKPQWRDWFFTLNVFQPRNYHPAGPFREWHFPGDGLHLLFDRLAKAAEAAILPNAPLRTGEHCRDCRARAGCPALQRAAMSAVDLSLEQHQVDLPADALGLELVILNAAIDRMKARVTGLTEQALNTIRRGLDVPHWQADYSSGRTRWTAPPAEVFILGDLYGVDLRKPPEPITPRQAEKAGVDRAVIKAYSETPRGALALVPFNQTEIQKRFA